MRSVTVRWPTPPWGRGWRARGWSGLPSGASGTVYDFFCGVRLDAGGAGVRGGGLGGGGWGGGGGGGWGSHLLVLLDDLLEVGPQLREGAARHLHLAIG